MWLLAAFTKGLIANRVFTSYKMLTIFSLIVLAILSESETLNVPQNAPAASRESDSPHNATKNNSAESNLLDKYNQFVKKYAHTLMNSTFLPFVGDCSAVMVSSKPVSQLKVKDRFLCLTYFDMIYNLAATNDENYTLADRVNTSLSDYDNATLVNNFCDFFGGELPTEDAKRPFVTTMLATQSTWINATQTHESCKLLCYYLDEPITQRILPICKLISGGYRLIKKNSLEAKVVTKAGAHSGEPILFSPKIGQNTSASEQIKAIPISSKINAQPVGATVANVTQSTTTIKNELQVHLIGAGANSISSKPSEAAKIKTSPMAKGPSDAAEPEAAHQSKDAKVNAHNEEIKPVVDINQEVEDTNDENGDVLGKGNSLKSNSIQFNILLFYAEDNKGINDSFDDTKTYDPDDGDDEADNRPDEVFSNTKPKYVNEHTKPKETHQIADGKNPSDDNTNTNLSSDALFDDTESNFFSYLMFLMVITIIFYIVYHNKTKVLALVIEGRRGRSGYSRNGSRRKHHSAEYRKLDSNLEEAIQSNDQVLTAQIIY